MVLRSIDPCSGRELARFDTLSEADVDAAIGAAASAFQRHRTTTFAERAARMHRAGDILTAEKRRWGELMTREMGKPIGAAIAEAEKCAWVCHHYAEHAEAMLADEPRTTDASRAFVRYQPLGPVLAVMPWNFPFWQVFRFAAPALMAGNIGLLKHASNVPQCALAIEEILRRAGFDGDEFRTLLVGSDTVEHIIADPRVRAVTLTGSEGAGEAVGEAAGKHLKKSVLELGGSDPFIVMPSADIARAAEIAVRARVINNGQSCIAAKRFIVHERVFDEFTDRFVAGMEALVVGDPMEERTDIGPLATEAICLELSRQVERTLQQGARLLTGGNAVDCAGWFYAPTVITDVPEDSPAYGEELFGPVASLFHVSGIDEAIALANATRFGLGSAAWTRDPAEQERFIEGLEAGLVFINAMVASDPRLPFGGVKASGYGRELDTVGIREFVNIKAVSMTGDAEDAAGQKETE
ncbi:MAG TPA: NAD-dependent succinate-semialdehyde dehydrogenase [Longimicrobiales bacterium]|nr:NAD-dependent succinate-semialdehyde dehydrogenase [Longimicrobiales bacterium]